MSRRKNSTVTVESIRRDVGAWVVQDGEGDGAWNMFILHTVKDMMQDYAVTFQYLSQITKEQFDFVCEAMDEVVFHFQKIELALLMEELYRKFYGENTQTDFYRDNIQGLRSCIKK